MNRPDRIEGFGESDLLPDIDVDERIVREVAAVIGAL